LLHRVELLESFFQTSQLTPPAPHFVIASFS
jgi:hypothetical protein